MSRIDEIKARLEAAECAVSQSIAQWEPAEVLEYHDPPLDPAIAILYANAPMDITYLLSYIKHFQVDAQVVAERLQRAEELLREARPRLADGSTWHRAFDEVYYLVEAFLSEGQS